jgi:hypothetical protein
MYAKDFNENEHMTCPECGFEIVYANKNKAAYIYNNGEIDHDTMTNDNEWANEEIIMCNHINCNWYINV